MIEIARYDRTCAPAWDAAVEASRNGTFLHRRAYMDYHADRFTDFSLIAFGRSGHIVAVLPADVSGSTLRSHAGLTYGGWLMSDRADMNTMMEVWAASRDFATAQGIDTLIYKPVPHIFHRYPAEEDLYALFRDGAATESVQVSSAIDLSLPLPFDQNARRGTAKAHKAGLTVAESTDYASFWHILGEVLAERHSTAPVHSLAEIELLAGRFPENIKLYGVFDGDRMIAGTVLYITPEVAHAQYIASDHDGRSSGALALLFGTLIEKFAGRVRYFDFGTSNEDGGRVLNAGLVRQKCGFGARAVAFYTYKVSWR